MRWSSASGPRWRRGRSIAPRWRGACSPARRTGSGSRGRCGRWWAPAWRRGWSGRARSQPRAAGGGGRGAAALRGGPRGNYDATIAVVSDEQLRAQGRRSRSRAHRRAGRPPALAGAEGAPGDLRGPQRRHGRRARGAAVGRPCQARRMSGRKFGTISPLVATALIVGRHRCCSTRRRAKAPLPLGDAGSSANRPPRSTSTRR